MTALDRAGATAPDEPATILYVGHHESQRSSPVTQSLLYRAQEAGYDIVTTPITTPHFQSRVLRLLQEHVDALSKTSAPANVPMPLISPLTPGDTDLSPEDSNSSLVAVLSAWIDVGSPDPLIAHISRQVLNLEIAYAAFCGIGHLLTRGPISLSGATQFGRVVLEAIGFGPYLQLHVLLPMTGELEEDISAEGTHLNELARDQYMPNVEGGENDDDAHSNVYESWEAWDTIRTICNYNAKISVVRVYDSVRKPCEEFVFLDATRAIKPGWTLTPITIALEIPRQLPRLSLQSRWYSEPVRLLTFPRTSFLRNAKGFPVLSKPHQHYLTRFLRLRYPPWALLCDVGPIPSRVDASTAAVEPTPAEATATAQQKPEDPTLHLKYMRHLQQTQPSRPPIERFGQGYQDYLQSPLQPLTDNLESITYEVFEKDPVKYEWYEQAVALALKDLSAKFGDGRPIIVAVVGAGRGPLVSRALYASKKTGVSVKCWAVEKNPNAYVLLQRRNTRDSLWNNQVTVVKSDMRAWPGPTISNGEIGKVDVLVSELLGSFADNELSPECLDGVQHVLHPDHGISIPQSYTAHVTPIATPRIHADLLSRASADLNMMVSEKWELPYVVMLHQYDHLCLQSESAEDGGVPDVQEMWSFSHPIPAAILEQATKRAGGTPDAGSGGWAGGDGSNEHNARSCTITFTCRHQGVCHGLAGYFETVLYHSPSSGEKVELSTNPVTMAKKSKDMISWFPIFFPLKTPLFIPEGAEMEVSMWRQTDDRKVWYEWLVEVFDKTGAKSSRRARVGMSELHSSRKNGCLM